jgi:hypothetical protein
VEVSPTAVHCERRTQETPPKKAPSDAEGFGLGTTDQAAPFHDSINVWKFEAGLEPPTAMQLDDVVQATSLRSIPGSTGLVARVHVDPFHDSINGSAEGPTTAWPTAVQAEGRLHGTPERMLS